MLWIRDWITNSIVLPLIRQVRNRIRNIKIINNADGTSTFTDSEGVNVTTGRTDTEANEIATDAVLAGNTTLNPNPYFTRGSLDFDEWINNSSRCSVVHDKVPNAAGALKMQDSVLTLVGDTFCPMPEVMSYKASIDVMLEKDGLADAGGGHVSFYMGIVSYDSDKRPIYPQNITYHNVDGTVGANTEPLVMEITRDFDRTDLYFTFKTGDLSKITYINQSHHRVCKFHSKQSNGEYSYVGVNGRVYDHLGMSQDISYAHWTELDSSKADNDPLKYIELTGNQVNGKDEYHLKLTTPLLYHGLATQYNIGDVWVQSYGGGTYSYWLSSIFVPVDAKWHHYDSAWFDASTQEGMNNYGRYRNGTAYVKLLLLPNYYYNDGVNGNRYPATADKIAGYYGNLALLKRSI